jgi:RHS repeat-associated protein
MTDYIYNEGSGDVSTSYTFNGGLVTGDSTGKLVAWDVNNGRQTSRLGLVPAASTIVYDWEGRLRQGKTGLSDSRIEAKYTPDGARVAKKRILNGNAVYSHKYIVDIAGEVAEILLVLDADRDNLIIKSYIYANGQVLAQQNGNHTANKYFYLHDRLGSVREVINTEGEVVRQYTYGPFGQTIEESSAGPQAPSNAFMFTGQWYDAEIAQYYLRARQYDPQLMRFTGRDPVRGQFEESMTMHRYLYCLNNPINYTDPEGLWTIHVMLSGMFTFLPSLMYQRGIVIDDEGNWGEIITSNDPHHIEGLDGGSGFHRDWGLGIGIPAVSAGVTVGWTNADTIFDLPGAGIQIGGSVSIIPPFGLGVDYIKGIQRSGEYYHGFEVVPQIGASVTGSWEVHGQATWNTVNPFESNLRNILGIDDIVLESVENTMFDPHTTLGQNYALLGIWAELQ